MRLKLIKDKTEIDFMKYRMLTMGLSIIMVISTLFLLFTKGLNLGIDFTGGILIEVEKPAHIGVDDIRSALRGVSERTPTIQEFGENSVMIKIPGKEADNATQKEIYNKVQTLLGTEVTMRRAEYVGPQVGSELISKGVQAFLWSMAGILLYIWMRFEWQFGLTGVIGVAHDTMATMLFFLVTGFEFDLSTVAAVLLIAGYSINETVVIFDRIREMMRKYRKMPMPELINLALNDTLSRTVMTTITTFICMACLAGFGTEAIKSFSYAMLIGIFFGPFSSVFVSSPLLYYMNIRRDPKPADEEGEGGLAAQNS